MASSSFNTEASIEFALSYLSVILRLFSRYKLVGFQGWGGDDYFCILASLAYLMVVVPVYLVGSRYGNNTGWTDNERAAFTPLQIKAMEIGSKLVVMGYFGYATVMWSLKASVLFYYDRVTAGLRQQKLVRACAIYCVITYVVVMITIAAHCRPFRGNWQVYPDPGRECTTHYTAYPVFAALNVSSDLILFYIPIPLLIQVKISITRKLLIGSLLCSSIFIMIASLLRCILPLKDINQINVSIMWTVREIFVAFLVINAPAIKPLFSKTTWFTGSKIRKSSHPSYRLSEMQNNTATATRRGVPNTIPQRDSEEFILVGGKDQAAPYGYMADVSKGDLESSEGGIKVTTEYVTVHERI